MYSLDSGPYRGYQVVTRNSYQYDKSHCDRGDSPQAVPVRALLLPVSIYFRTLTRPSNR
jgi:hypothetical protein